MAEEGKPAFGIGSFMWYELKTKDIAKSREFFSKVAGWKYDEMDMGPGGIYTIIKAGDQTVGGMMPMDGPDWGDMPSHWSYYADVEDVDSSAAKVEKLGGKNEHPTMDVPDVGRFTGISAPDGSNMYIMTPAHRATEPPCPDAGHFLWVELMSRDFDKAKEFYTKLMGWDVAEMPMPEGYVYNIFMSGNGGVGGGMNMPPEVPPEMPSCWMGYIHAPDLDKALKAVDANGGQIAMPPMEVPGVGRMAHVMDPSGAVVALMTPAVQGK